MKIINNEKMKEYSRLYKEADSKNEELEKKLDEEDGSKAKMEWNKLMLFAGSAMIMFMCAFSNLFNNRGKNWQLEVAGAVVLTIFFSVLTVWSWNDIKKMSIKRREAPWIDCSDIWCLADDLCEVQVLEVLHVYSLEDEMQDVEFNIIDQNGEYDTLMCYLKAVKLENQEEEEYIDFENMTVYYREKEGIYEDSVQ